jgi:enterochelin esterase-like enzyme/sugar lactone lactonase YvrE
MNKFCLLVGLLAALAGLACAGEDYPLGPDSQRQPGVPQGKVTHYTFASKDSFPGTVRDYWVYVPAQYTPEKPACVMVFQDGKGYISEDGRARIPIVFDNLIAKHDMPVTIAILIDPGVLKALAPGQADRVNRSFEYDGLSDRYAMFLLVEILPEVAKHYNLSTNPDDRAISGLSSGGICSFTVAWTHPEAFHRVLSNIGSFTDLRGGDVYPALIRKTEPKPLRVFLQDGNHDLNNFAGDWWLANQSMASALTFAGYDVRFVTGDKDHDMIQGGAIMPDALRWLWRDYPQSIAKPRMHPLGDRQTGFVEVGPDWELVSDPHNAPPRSLGSTMFTFAGGIASLLQLPSGIAVDQQGNVFYTEHPGKVIYKIDTNGHISTFVDNADVAMGLAVGPDGLLYACERTGIASYAANGKKSIRAQVARCLDLVATRNGGFYFTGLNMASRVSYVPPRETKEHSLLGLVPDAMRATAPHGIRMSSDESVLYTSQLGEKWVWSYQVQADGSLANGEPYFRMETLDESSESGASGMAVDSQGLLYVATLMGIQICDQQGRVVAILNGPEQADPSQAPVSGIAFGGPEHEYLYAVVGNEIFRRHLVRKPPQP